MIYLAFVRSNLRFLCFGVLLTASASFGQTFFIALYMGEARATFGLGHGDIGNLYLAGTLMSGFTMIWLGRLVDVMALRAVAMTVTAGLALGCVVMAWTPAAWTMAVAFFLLRLFGQGMMTHTAITGTARHFEADRGKAVGIVSSGQPLAESVLPIIAVALTAAIGWRWSWAVYTGLLVLVAVPAIYALLAAHGAARPSRHGQGLGRPREVAGHQWTRTEVLRDLRFYLLVPAVLAPAYVSTGLIFHQAHTAEVRGWSLTWIATCFVGYAVAKGVATFLLGPVVDRWTARRVARLVPLPLALSAAVLAGLTHEIGAFIYLATLGAASGASQTAMNAMWAEMYGTRHLGSIRAMAFSLSVTATAIAPASMGWWIDAGAGIEAIAWGCVIYTLIATLPLNVAMSLRR
jgi:MFS family permease